MVLIAVDRRGGRNLEETRSFVAAQDFGVVKARVFKFEISLK